MNDLELRPCPFCGGEVELMNLFTPIKMFYCTNYQTCPSCGSEMRGEQDED